jgi:hypothetical protein
VKALATIFPSGERDSADHVVSDPPLRQPDDKKHTPRTRNSVVFRIDERPSALAFIHAFDLRSIQTRKMNKAGLTAEI